MYMCPFNTLVQLLPCLTLFGLYNGVGEILGLTWQCNHFFLKERNSEIFECGSFGHNLL